jgi:two-component system, OmpR family, heavy metal sensor histidine kinase CusS
MTVKVFPPAWPISRRLTVLYSVSLFLLLAVSAAFLDWVLRTDMRYDSSQFLAAEMQSVRTLMRQRPADTRAWREEAEREAASLPGYARYYVRIVDEQGGTVVETPGMRDIVDIKTFPEPLSAYVKTMDGRDARGRDGRLLLLGSQWVELREPEAGRRVIQVALDRSHDAMIIADYRRKILIMLFAGMALSVVLGVTIAKAGLKALTNITRAFRRISADELNTRVSSAEWPPEVAALATEFDAMLERLENSFALLTQFSADLAHELRTPINNLRGEAEVALEKSRSADEYRDVLESSLEEYERLSRVIDNLLFLARADTRNTAVRLTSVNSRKEIDALIEYFDPLSQDREIEISVTGNALLNVDAGLFRRALINIFSNAFQYTPPKGQIAVSVATLNREVEIAVADTGIGIEKDNLKKVLDRFYRSDKARALHPHGTGLGLAIVKSIMDLHSGYVMVDSAPGKGTTIKLRFPQA